MDFIKQFNDYALKYPKKAPPVVVGHPEFGKIGIVENKRFSFHGMSEKHWNALMRDEWKLRSSLLQLLYDERGSITNWDAVLNARVNGREDDRLYYKLSQTTVANNWSNFFRSGGVPGAGAYTNIPVGAVHNVNSAGAFPLINPTSPNRKYLLNFGVNHIGAAAAMNLNRRVSAQGVKASGQTWTLTLEITLS